MITPIVSIIVPIYNEAEYLPACLDSLLEQTLKDIEIICIDDGSTDSTPQILEQYRQTDSRIKVITTANRGAGAARNEGLKVARGEWLAFCDADDFMSPYALEHAVAAGNRYGTTVVCFDREYCESNADASIVAETSTKKETKIKKPSDFSNIFAEMIGLVTNKLFLHSFVSENNITFQEIYIREDAFFCFSACLLSERIAVMDEKLYYYRNVEGSQSRKMNHDIEDVYAFLKGVLDFLDRENLYEQYKRAFVNFSVEHIAYSLSTVYPENYVQVYNDVQKRWLSDLRLTGYENGFYEQEGLINVLENVKLNLSDINHQNNPIHNLVFESLNIQRERDYYKAACLSVTNSHFWRYTAPLRELLDWIKALIK